jgi:hypothetical protein
MRESAKKLQQVSPAPLSETVSNFIRSVNRGSIRIDIDSIKLELGDKFTEMILVAGVETISNNIRKHT